METQKETESQREIKFSDSKLREKGPINDDHNFFS